MDITDKTSIEKFRKHIEEKHGGIDVLINNAAIAFPVNSTEPFNVQAEVTLHVNYFSLVDVCNSLFGLLRNNARVVQLSSSAGHLSRIPSKELRAKISDPNLTVSKLNELMRQFVK